MPVHLMYFDIIARADKLASRQRAVPPCFHATARPARSGLIGSETLSWVVDSSPFVRVSLTLILLIGSSRLEALPVVLRRCQVGVSLWRGGWSEEVLTE